MPLKNTNSKKEKILELKTRKRIYEIVKKYSGCHFREIERKSKIPHGTLRYHLSFLVKHGLLNQKKDNNHLRYFPSEFGSENVELLSFLRQGTMRKIILFILTHKNCHHEEIVGFVNLSPSTVSWHLRKLVISRIITAKREGRNVKYDLAINEGDLIKLLIIYRESFFDSLVNRIVEMWEFG